MHETLIRLLLLPEDPERVGQARSSPTTTSESAPCRKYQLLLFISLLFQHTCSNKLFDGYTCK